MKTQRYTYLFLFTLLACLFFSSAGFAQRGYRSNRGYHYNYYPQRSYHYYYPQRSYSYNYYPQRNYAYSRPYMSVYFNNYHYRYQQGYFYRPYGSVFQLVIPPFGIRIGTLPYGYRSFYLGPDPYYYYNGIYYRPYGNQYEVVAPPLGAVVDRLPQGAKVKVIDGQKYYELNGTYYKEELDENNEPSYTVVGTDGVLNTDAQGSLSYEPVIGDRIDRLPSDSRAVVIQGEKLYSTPSGLYYKEVTEGGKVYYELVGK